MRSRLRVQISHPEKTKIIKLLPPGKTKESNALGGGMLKFRFDRFVIDPSPKWRQQI